MNDPVYGFISISDPLIFELIQHPWFQRLRRINQLGLTNYVYPGANHTRFHHAIGAYNLMKHAIAVLIAKGHEITDEEIQGSYIAILLHDIGHGPYSHTLEDCLVKGVSHEYLSQCFMDGLNEQFNGQLTTAIQIFRNEYPKQFLHQLVSGQLDMDRMDYLKRDSFFTGVHEGVIGHDRIIKMLEVVDDQLVVEEKGSYSIEKFLVARRLMYWQVYLHKTVICAEDMLIKVLQRAKELSTSGETLFATPTLQYFLKNDVSWMDFTERTEALEYFSRLDDYDVFTSIKAWVEHNDVILSTLCKGLVFRNLLRIKILDEPTETTLLEKYRSICVDKYELENPQEAEYLVFDGSTSIRAYNPESSHIRILQKDGTIKDIANASDNLNFASLRELVTKYYVCYPKDLAL